MATRERRSFGPSPAGAARAIRGGSNVAPFIGLPLRHAPRSDAPHRSADPKLFAAVALLIAVLVADALLIWAAVPGLADLASFYVSTT